MRKLNIIPVLALAILLSGCAGFEKNAGKALSTIAVTVDGGMKGWAALVVAGKTSDAQQAQVRTAYGQYQLSMDLARTAYFAAIQIGDQKAYNISYETVSQSKDNLITLLQSFGVNVSGTK